MGNIDVASLAPKLSVTDYKAVEPLLADLDKFLTLRTYLEGYDLGESEKQAWIALRKNKVAVGIVRKGSLINLQRWFTYIEVTHPELKSEVAKPKRPAEAKTANYDIGLKDTENGVVTRFPPEPS